MNRYKSYFKWFLWTLLILVMVRVFLYQTTVVRDFHMASTLMPGDRILVDKYRAGLRLPISILGLPGVNAPYADGIRLPYLRLPAIRKLSRQQLIVFNFPAGADKPLDRKRLMISRIIGLPADSVRIRDKQVYVNNQVVPPPSLKRSEYRVVTAGQPIDNKFIKKHTIEKPRVIAQIGIYDADLSMDAREILGKMEGIKNVRETRLFPEDATLGYYPNSSFFSWNRDQYGPFRVPFKGMTVDIGISTVDFYRDIIETHEGHDIMVDFAGVHIDGQIATSYTFRKDYYFVLSDNRDNPNDSRKIGFVPADHILGVTKRIIWSHQNKFDYIRRFHPERILKKIR